MTTKKDLVDLLKLCDPRRRTGVSAPEDTEILALCERIGFGAVMDSAARQWYARNPSGAFTVGPCAGSVIPVLNAIERATC